MLFESDELTSSFLKVNVFTRPMSSIFYFCFGL